MMPTLPHRPTAFPRRAALLGVFLAILALPARGQSTEKIVDQYVRAMGGAKSLAKIESAKIVGAVHEPGVESAGSYTLLLKAPNKFYSEILIGDDRSIEAFNGKSAWLEDSAAAHTLTGNAPALAASSGRFWNGRLADAKKDKIEMRFAGVETIGGRPADHIELTFSRGARRQVFFDQASHLLVREILTGAPQIAASPDAGAPIQYDYSDYRKTSGVPVAYAVEIHGAGRDFRVSVTSVEFGAAIADSVFDFPAVAGSPLPDIPTLLRDVVKNQSAIEQITRQYTCHLSEQEEKSDSQGKITSSTVSEYDVFYVGGEEVRHLLAKNGKPLEGEEKQKEDERFNKEFDKLQKKAAETAADPKKQQKQAEEDQAQISDFLKAERLTNPRRERFRGEDVIVFDFGPNPDYKPKNLEESVVQKLVGVIWVDEQARDVARLEAVFSENAKIGGGLLASLSKGSNLVFEQSLVNNEVWLPSYTEVHASARVLFLRAKANEIDRYSNYRKFQVETHIGAAVPVDNPAGPGNAPAAGTPSAGEPSPK